MHAERRKAVAFRAFVAPLFTMLVAGCTSSSPPVGIKSSLAKSGPSATNEYFAEAEYGVKASPRVVANTAAAMPRGGGREQVGRPYQVKGKWYYPKDEPGYSATGKASWYGAAFHGRLTANGEIYDMNHLSAAHPTLPLPSYARVTNIANGTSVIVRINDRGPYAHGRVIDLSKKAAELLGYKNSGTANVKVDYVGKAPVHGRDDAYLLASYQPGGAGAPIVPQPSSDVMIAMNGPTPLRETSQVVQDAFAVVAPPSLPTGIAADPQLPEIGPFIEFRLRVPVPGNLADAQMANVINAYADQRVSGASDAAGALDDLASGLTANRLQASYWSGVKSRDTADIHIGTFTSDGQAQAAINTLRLGGDATVVRSRGYTTVFVHVADSAAGDTMLRAAWKAGFADAFRILE
jgi:rare lipoprotein A